jgi:hypothetical protein
MQSVRRFFDERDPGKFGTIGEPELDHIIAPVAAEAGKGLENRSAAACSDRNEAARVQRAARLARCQVNDLDRSIEVDPRRDIEDEAVGEKRGIERGERPRSVERRRFDRGPYQIRSLCDRRRRGTEPDARRQSLDRGELRREPPVDEDEPIRRLRKPDFGELGARWRSGYNAHRAGRKHRGLFKPA